MLYLELRKKIQEKSKHVIIQLNKLEYRSKNELILDKMDIKLIGPEGFIEFENIFHLNLDLNKLEILENGCFNYLHNLRKFKQVFGHFSVYKSTTIAPKDVSNITLIFPELFFFLHFNFFNYYAGSHFNDSSLSFAKFISTCGL
jgi:hypothetical protein